MPREVFAANGNETVVAEPAGPTAAPEPSLAERLARLLDRSQPRRPDELDLAEAVCAVTWPNWPAYTGAVDLHALREALARLPLDADTLHWLGSNEFARSCRAAAPS